MSDLLDRCVRAALETEYAGYLRFNRLMAPNGTPLTYEEWRITVLPPAQEIEGRLREQVIAIARVLLKEPASPKMVAAWWTNAEETEATVDWAAMAAALLSELEGETPATGSAESGSTPKDDGATS